jgi:hypothetical protein
VLDHYSGRAREVPGVSWAAKGAQLFHVHGGKVTRIVHYGDRERAFADLGLSEQDAHADS